MSSLHSCQWRGAAGLLLLLQVFVSLLAVNAQETAVPVIKNVTGCPLQQGAATLGCQPAVLITLLGDKIGNNAALIDVNGADCQPLSATSLSFYCRLLNLELPLQPLGQLLPVTLRDLSTGATSAPAVLVAAAALPPLMLTSVSGCQDSGLSTYGCNVTTAVLTVRGSGFQALDDSNNHAAWQVIYNSAQAALTFRQTPLPLRYVDNATMLLTLSLLGERLSASGVLTFAIAHGNVVSNPLSVGFIATADNSAPPPAEAPTNITLSSVSGCMAQAGVATTGCTKPATLTLTGSGFPLAGVMVRVGPERCSSVSVLSSQQLVCVVPNSWSGIPQGELLPVVVYDFFNVLQSAALPAVQFLPLQAPRLSSVAGCSGSGAATLLCDSEHDVITLTGSNFYQDANPWQLRMQGYLPLSLPHAAVLNASTILVPAGFVSQVNRYITARDMASSAFYLYHAGMVSTPLTISFALPPLVVVNLTSSACTSTSPLTLVDCSAAANFQFDGANFIGSQLTITIAGMECAIARLTETVVQCTMPPLQGFTPGLPYDVVLSRGGVSLTLPGAVSLLAQPTITAITSQFCPNDYAPERPTPTLLCDVGSVLTVTGSFFSPSELLQVRMVGYSSLGDIVLQCANVTLVMPTLLTCVLPELSGLQTALYGAYLQVQVVENATLSSNVYSVQAYRSPQGPALRNVTGCSGYDAATRGSSGCVTGATLTLNGENFGTSRPSSGSVAVDLYDLEIGVLYACLTPVLLSSSRVTCVLPYMPRQDQEAADFPVRLRFPPYSASNWLLAVGYSSALSNQAECAAASSDYWAAFVASLTAAVAMSVLAALLASYIARMRNDPCCVKKPLSEQQQSDAEVSATAAQAVELHSW